MVRARMPVPELRRIDPLGKKFSRLSCIRFFSPSSFLISYTPSKKKRSGSGATQWTLNRSCCSSPTRPDRSFWVSFVAYFGLRALSPSSYPVEIIQLPSAFGVFKTMQSTGIISSSFSNIISPTLMSIDLTSSISALSSYGSIVIRFFLS